MAFKKSALHDETIEIWLFIFNIKIMTLEL